MDIAYIHGKVHAIGGYLPMRWVEYDHEEVPISMDVADPWVPCNIYATAACAGFEFGGYCV